MWTRRFRFIMREFQTIVILNSFHGAFCSIVEIRIVITKASSTIAIHIHRRFAIHDPFCHQLAHATCAADLVSAYGSGLVTPALVGGLVATLARLGRRLPVVVDSRYQLDRFRDLTACTPNESELEHVLGVTVGDDPEALERAGRTLLRRTRSEAVLVTRGSRGMALFERGKPTVHVPIFGSDEIADVTGAGDTVIATTTLALASGATFTEAARLANYAGGLVVMKRGTATVSADELRGAVRDDLGE